MALTWVTIGVLALIGLALRKGVAPLRWVYVPASVVGGFVGLAVMQATRRGLPDDHALRTTAIELSGELSSLPRPMLAILFAAMLLHKAPSRGGKVAKRVARQGLMVWLIVLGQIVVGLAAMVILIRPMGYALPGAFGQLIEATFAGGHGTGGAMGELLEGTQAVPAALDLAMLMATIALVGGTLLGVGLVNVGIRRGWTSMTTGTSDRMSSDRPSLREVPQPAAYARVRSDVLDPLMLQLALVALAFGIGMAMQWGVVDGIEALLQSTMSAPVDREGMTKAERVAGVMKYVGNLPLFLFTLLGGLLLRYLLSAVRLSNLTDGPSLDRVAGVAIDVLIISAIATLRIETVVAYLTPATILLGLGFAWALFCLLVLAPRLLPRGHWFELGLINFGMSTGTTAQGMMLLRMADPKLESDAAEDYALAAPLSAPFIGGGVITFTLPLLMGTVAEPGVSVWIVVGALSLVWLALLATAWWLSRGTSDVASSQTSPRTTVD